MVMDTIHDIIFGGIRNGKKTPDWRKIPIHIHHIAPYINSLAMSHMSPGIHYAYTDRMNYDQLKDEIYGILDKCLGIPFPMAPAGVNRGVLKVSLPSGFYCQKDRDILYDLGINPIAYLVQYGMVLWGQKFITKSGTIERIVDNAIVHRDFLAFL